MADRTYSREEIHRLLERALEMQTEATPSSSEPGLSLEELEEVARASGVDPAFIKRAAAELDAPPQGLTAETSTHVFAERTVEGDLSDEAWTDLVIELRRRFEKAEEEGSAVEERLGATRAWRYIDDEELKTQAFVTPRDGHLHIRLSQSVASADSVLESAIWSGIAAVVLGSLGSQFVEGALLGTLAYVIAFLVAFPVVYGLDRRWRGAKQRDLDATADALAGILSTSAGSDAINRRQQQPEIDLSDADGFEEETSTSSESHQREGQRS